MDILRISIIEGSREVCDYYSNILSQQEGIVLTGCFSSGYEGLAAVMSSKPQVLLVDEHIDGNGTGIALSKALLGKLPDTKIILLTHSLGNHTVGPAFKAGIVDYLLKKDAPEMIVKTIRDVELLLHPRQQDITERVYTRNIHPEGVHDSLMYTLTVVSQLTPKEIEITKMLADGKVYAEIAAARHLSVLEVEEQTDRIVEKFNKKNPTDLIKMLRILNIMEFFDHVP